MHHLKMVIFGITYGIASPVPGLDGGTFFILFNVYEDFIHAANLTNIRKKLPVALLFLLGCIAGLFGISNLMMRLLNNHEMIMYFSFIGLILGCIPMIYKKSAFNIKAAPPLSEGSGSGIHSRCSGGVYTDEVGDAKHRATRPASEACERVWGLTPAKQACASTGHPASKRSLREGRAPLKMRAKHIAIFAISLAVMLFLAFYGTDPDTYDYMHQLYETSTSLVWVFFASAASAVGMLVPGVGGAILMIVLGIYTIYIEAVASLDMTVLLTMAAGMVFGILSGIKIVRKILTTYPGELYCAILGFTIGSVFIVFPGFAANLTGLLSIVSMVLFAIIAYQFSKKS